MDAGKLESLKEELAGHGLEATVAHGLLALDLEPRALLEVAQKLKTTLGFDPLLDVTAVDWPRREPRFGMVERQPDFGDTQHDWAVVIGPAGSITKGKGERGKGKGEREKGKGERRKGEREKGKGGKSRTAIHESRFTQFPKAEGGRIWPGSCIIPNGLDCGGG